MFFEAPFPLPVRRKTRAAGAKLVPGVPTLTAQIPTTP